MSQVGFVPADHLLGRVRVVYFSHAGSAPLAQLGRWLRAIRIDRIGREIE